MFRAAGMERDVKTSRQLLLMLGERNSVCKALMALTRFIIDTFEGFSTI